MFFITLSCCSKEAHLSDLFLLLFFFSFLCSLPKEDNSGLLEARIGWRRLPPAAAAAAAAAARPAGDSLLVEEEEEEEEEQKELEPGEVETSAALQCPRLSRSACAGY